jgi:hypothetical protein
MNGSKKLYKKYYDVYQQENNCVCGSVGILHYLQCCNDMIMIPGRKFVYPVNKIFNDKHQKLPDRS